MVVDEFWRHSGETLFSCGRGYRERNYYTGERKSILWKPVLLSLQEDVLETVCQSATKDQDAAPPSASEVEQVALQNKAISELDELLTELRAKCSRQPSYAIEIVMYFDEAHSLTALKPKNENEKTLYDVFCSVLNTFLRYPVFVIFLSTNSDLAELATPRSLAQSARIRDGRATIHAPITETPFDCYPDMLIRPVTMSFVETTTVEYMAKFGRPL
jgi:hypothetical protein